MKQNIMKHKMTKHIISLSLLLAIFASQINLASAQTPVEDAFTTGGKSLYTLPSNAVVGSTDERRNAYNSLSAADKT